MKILLIIYLRINYLSCKERILCYFIFIDFVAVASDCNIGKMAAKKIYADSIKRLRFCLRVYSKQKLLKLSVLA